MNEFEMLMYGISRQFVMKVGVVKIKYWFLLS